MSQMIIGDPARFALESRITTAYLEPGLRALGLFVIHICGKRYGVYEPDAALLACSFDQVRERIAWRGKHTFPFSDEPDAGKIADAFRNAIYAPDQEKEMFFGVPHAEFRALFYQTKLVWAPDGDEAFDDGSFVLQFDKEDTVRLIGFKTKELAYEHEPSTLADFWIGATEFYRILEEWSSAFEKEWSAAPKAD
jgi:hypothetical protein